MDQRVSENQPWCEMLVKIQEVTRDLTGSSKAAVDVSSLQFNETVPQLHGR